MFNIGDFVSLTVYPRTTFIVTRICNEEYIVIATYDAIDGFVNDEYKVNKKYFKKNKLCNFDIPGMSYENLLRNFIDSGYFKKSQNGTIEFICTESSLIGCSPICGLPLRLFGFTAID